MKPGNAGVVILCSLLAVMLSSAPLRAQQTVFLTSPHDFPPFVTGRDSGLTHDLAQLLSQRSNDYQFMVRVVPRKRLGVMLEKEDMVVPWVTPVWFGPDALEKYHWSGPLMEDGSVYVWRRLDDISFTRPEDLIGHRLGGIRGYRYVGVDPLVNAGRIDRQDTSSERLLLRLIKHGRVDVGIGPESGIRYLIRAQGMTDLYALSRHHGFTRRILVKSGDSVLTTLVERVVEELVPSDLWRDILAGYGLEAKDNGS